MSQNLYNFLVEKGDYTKSYEDFVLQFSTPSSQDSLYNFMSQKGDYTKNNNDFKNQFFNQSTDYNVAGDNISISQQEMDEIISQANADPIEKIKKGEIEQKQFNPYAKGYGAYVAPRKEIKYQSYVFDEFLNEDQSNVEQAKQQWISKKRKELLQGKLEEQLEDLEDKIIPWYSIRGIDPLRPIHDAMYASKRAILTNEFKAKEQQANEDYKKLSNKLTSDKQAIEGIDLKLNNIKSRYDRNPESLTQQDVDDFNDLILTREAAVDAFNDDLERLDNLGVKSQDFNTIADMTQRTYNNIDVAANRISSTVLESSAGLVDFAYNFSVPGLMKNIGGIDVQKEEDIQTLPTFIQPIARQMGTVVEGENITTDKLRKNAEEINNFTKHRQEFSKIDSIENFGEFVLDLFSEQLVNTAVTASTGGVGLAIISASAAGNKMNQMSIDIEKYLETGGKEGQMISPLQFYTAGVGYGLAEYVTEKVALKQFKGARKAFNDAVNLDGMGRYSLKEFKFTDAAKRYGINVNQEGSAELFAGGTQNFLDKYVLDQDVDLRDNLLESYVSGVLISGLGFQAPVLAQDIYRSFSTTSEWGKINTNSQKIASLQEDLKNLYRKNVNDPQVKEAIKLNNEQINDLLVENLRIKKVAENRIDDLSADDKGSLIHLTSEAYKHKKKIDEINSNENLTQQQKEYLIIKHADKLDSLYSKQEQIRKSATFSKDKERNKKATIEYAILTGRKIENIIIEEGDNAVEKIQAYIDDSDISPELKNQFKTEIKEVIEANPYVHGAHFGKEFDLPISIQFADNATRGIGGNATVFSHELGHGTLFRALVEQGADVVQLTKNLEGYVKKRFPKLYSKFIKTHRLYREGDAAYRAEEVLAMTTDFMRQYNIEADKSLQGKLIDSFNNIVRKNKNIAETNEVKTGRDVFNLLKSFAFGFEAGEISGLAARVIKGEADILKTDKPVSKEKQPVPLSKEASDNVQRIYDEQGVAGAMDIIDAFKPITNKLVQRRSEAPNFDRQLLTDEIETGQRGIFDLIREYKPDSGVPLAAYINKFLPARAIEASRRVLGEEFTEDVTEAKTVAAEEVAEPTVTTKPKPKKIVLADRLGVGEEVNKAIQKIIPKLDLDNLNFKNLKNQVPNIVGKLFGIAPKKLITNANITKSELQSAQMFINKNADLLIAMLPEGATAGGTATGVPNTLLKAFYTKTGRAKMAKTGTKAGLALQQKNDIKKTDFLETFGIIDGKPDRTDRNTSARALALANTLGKMITNQAVRQQDLNLSNESISKLKDGKSSIMYSLEPVENVKNDIKGNFTKRSGLKYANGEPVTTILKDKSYIEKRNEETGEITGSVVDIKQMEALWDEERGITWSQHMASRLNYFLDKNPQYYDALQELFTGGVKRTAYMAKDIFEAAVPKTDKIKETEQISADRLDYHRTLSKKEKEKGLKGKRLRKNIQELDRSKDKNKTKTFIKFFNDISKYLNDGQNMLDLWLMEEMLLHSSVDQNNFFRKSAQVLGFPVDANGNPIVNQVVIEEHTPINEVIKIAMGGAIRNNVKDITPLLESLLSQVSILAKDDPSGKLKSSMGIDFYNKVAPRILDGSLKLKPGHAGIYRLMKHGVNPFRYKLLESGKTIAQEFGVDGMTVKTARENIIKYFEGEVSLEYNVQMSKVPFSKDIDSYNTFNKAIMFSRSTNESKGITVLDFDDTLATTESLVKYTTPDGKTGTLNAEQYASTYEDLLDQGFTFDFSDFNKVVKGKLAPLFQKALKLQKKFGPENMFVLTARPPAAQKPIFDFLKANGLNIPLKNITGLANSTSEAKALWIADKVADGYNDFYFADDALQNVQAVDNMLEQFDVKRKVQQAKVKFSKDIDSEFNKILEDVTGIEAGKRFSEQKARKRGASKGKFRFFIPPSHEDFVGLLYNFMGKGRKGDQHRDFFEQALVRPLNRAYREIDTAKQAIANDYKELNKQFADVKKKLRKKTPDGDYIFEDAVRIYLWNKHGYDIPGLSKTDQANLSELVMSDPQLQAYAETLNVISKQDTYVEPGKGWDGGNIKTDLIDATGRVGRAQYFTEFNENADVIFSPENLNKIEAAYGRNFRSAVEDILHRIKTGVNRPKGQSGTVNAFMNYLNGSVGTVMFFNVRSAILQQMSIVNYINFADNNIFAAGKAFANQPQYWKDFAFIFNSDMLKQRRGGIGTDINGNDLAQAVAGSKNPTKIVISKLLKLGFLPTQIGDNIAIATGGATFYRNRINKYIKDGLSKKEAETRAFTDFQDLTQSTQQSSRPDMTSQQQASWIGKLVLNFQNITSQYNRIIKKAALDIGKGRISPPYTTRMQSNLGNLSKILYYGAIQNVIFYSLQTALFAVMFDDDEDEDQILKKKERVIQGTIDSILRGAGIYGAVASTLKNAYIRFKEQREKGYNKDESAVPLELANFSPVVGIKLRQLVNAEKTLNYNENVIGEMETFEADNPMWSAVTNYTQALTNFPANRLYQKSINMRNALDKDYTNFQRVLFFSGYTTWSLGLGDTEAVIEAKEKVKINKANAKKEKRAQKQIEKIAANKSIVEENKKKKDGRCAAISTSGKRCSNKAVKDGFCSIHEKVEQREDGKKLRCRKTKSDGTRCRMMTTNKSQYCYYHD